MATPKWLCITILLCSSLAQTLAEEVKPRSGQAFLDDLSGVPNRPPSFVNGVSEPPQGDGSGNEWRTQKVTPGYGSRPGSGSGSGTSSNSNIGGRWGGPGVGYLPPYVPNMPPGYRPPGTPGYNPGVPGYNPGMPGYNPVPPGVPSYGPYPSQGGIFYCTPETCWAGNPLDCQRGFSLNLNQQPPTPSTSRGSNNPNNKAPESG